MFILQVVRAGRGAMYKWPSAVRWEGELAKISLKQGKLHGFGTDKGAQKFSWHLFTSSKWGRRRSVISTLSKVPVFGPQPPPRRAIYGNVDIYVATKAPASLCPCAEPPFFLTTWAFFPWMIPSFGPLAWRSEWLPRDEYGMTSSHDHSEGGRAGECHRRVSMEGKYLVLRPFLKIRNCDQISRF